MRRRYWVGLVALALTGVLIEDSTVGVVQRAPFGLGGPRYQINAYDHERLLEGTRRLAELHFAMGATKVLLPFAHMHVVHSPDELAKRVRELMEAK